MAEVRAEITANVWQVTAEPGQSVAEGDEICILESMKMDPRGRRDVRGPVGAARGTRRRGAGGATSSPPSTSRDPLGGARRRGGAAVIDRPSARNALDAEHCLDLRRRVEAASGVRALVITGRDPPSAPGPIRPPRRRRLLGRAVRRRSRRVAATRCGRPSRSCCRPSSRCRCPSSRRSTGTRWGPVCSSPSPATSGSSRPEPGSGSRRRSSACSWAARTSPGSPPSWARPGPATCSSPVARSTPPRPTGWASCTGRPPTAMPRSPRRSSGRARSRRSHPSPSRGTSGR